MILLGIDPDTKATGMGVFKGGKPVMARSCISKGRYAKDRAAGSIEAIHEALREIEIDLAPPGRPPELKVAIEWQKIRAGENAGKAQNIADLLGISYACLAVVKFVFPYSQILLPLPAEWKGTIPKGVHQKRLRKKLGLDGANAELLAGMTNTNASHAIDGLGLALWLHERRR